MLLGGAVCVFVCDYVSVGVLWFVFLCLARSGCWDADNSQVLRVRCGASCFPR